MESFWVGILVGFFTAFILVLSFIWFFLLRSPFDNVDSGPKRLSIVRRKRKLPQHVPSPVPIVQESCQWLNECLSHLIFDPILNDPALIKDLVSKLEAAVNVKRNNLIGPVHLDDVRMGARVPRIVTMEQASDSKVICMRVEWKDALQATVATAVRLGNGVDVLAELPIGLTMRLLKLSCSIKVTLGDVISLCLEDEFTLDSGQ